MISLKLTSYLPSVPPTVFIHLVIYSHTITSLIKPSWHQIAFHVVICHKKLITFLITFLSLHYLQTVILVPT